MLIGHDFKNSIKNSLRLLSTRNVNKFNSFNSNIRSSRGQSVNLFQKRTLVSAKSRKISQFSLPLYINIQKIEYVLINLYFQIYPIFMFLCHISLLPLYQHFTLDYIPIFYGERGIKHITCSLCVDTVFQLFGFYISYIFCNMEFNLYNNL